LEIITIEHKNKNREKTLNITRNPNWRT